MPQQLALVHCCRDFTLHEERVQQIRRKYLIALVTDHPVEGAILPFQENKIYVTRNRYHLDPASAAALDLRTEQSKQTKVPPPVALSRVVNPHHWLASRWLHEIATQQVEHAVDVLPDGVEHEHPPSQIEVTQCAFFAHMYGAKHHLFTVLLAEFVPLLVISEIFSGKRIDVDSTVTGCGKQW